MPILQRAFAVACLTLLAGCSLLVDRRPPAYDRLAGQSIGVYVWADQGIRIDWPSLQLDLANTIQEQMRSSAAKELKDSTYPVLPASILRYLRENPAQEHLPIADLAPRFGVARLVHVEVADFRTRSEYSHDLFRGSMSAAIRVVEVADGMATVVFEESDVKVSFPEGAPPEGILAGRDYDIYLGVIRAFATQVVQRVTTHEVDP